MRLALIPLAASLVLGSHSLPAQPQSTESSAAAVLFENVRVFDGKATNLSEATNVLVVGNMIKQMSRTTIDAGAGVVRIAGSGRTLMPGLIDAHWHSMLAAPDMTTTMMVDIGFLNLLAAGVARQTLLQGFTTVRDMGGPVFGLKMAIDKGLVEGPRIFPSGAMISQSGGHGDFRMPYEVPRPAGSGFSHAEIMGAAIVADGADAVLQRAREQLMLGASQLKLMAGGGVSSHYDPIDVAQYTTAELHAAVDAAENWGTYVAVHAYTSRAVRSAIEAGVKCIDHGQLVDEDTAKLMAKHGVWWSLQPFLGDEDANPKEGDSKLKQQLVSAGTDRAYKLAKKYGIKVAFGTDILFNQQGIPRHTAQLAKLTRWYSPGEVLKIATGNNGELLALAGERAPYRGRIGVVEEGALADLLLIDGDPTVDISLIEDPHRNFVVIMKDGVIVKNALAIVR